MDVPGHFLFRKGDYNMADHHDYCRLLLKMVRDDAKLLGKKIPPISSSNMGPDSYAVFIGDDWYDEYNSCCAFYARHEAIEDFINNERSPLNKTQYD